MPVIMDQASLGGVCGFVSVINGMILSSPDANAFDELGERSLYFNLCCSMLEYLKSLGSEPSISKEIETFTKSFGPPYNQLTYLNMIQTIQKYKETLLSSNATPPQLVDWGVAMPPNAIAHFSNWLGYPREDILKQCVSASNSNALEYKGCLLGLGCEPFNEPWKGLKHWVYINDAGALLNWNTYTRLDTLPRADLLIDRPRFAYITHAFRLK